MATMRNHSTAGNGATAQADSQNATPCHAQSTPMVRIADGRRKPAERTLGLPAVAAMLDRGAAGEGVKTIRRPMRNAHRKGQSSLPRCVGCLLAIGWGQKRICRHTGLAKTSVHRWAKFNGSNLGATAEQKKAAEMAVRKRRAAEKRKARLAEWAEKKAERAARPKRTAMDSYYANHEKSKARARIAAAMRYMAMEHGSHEHLKRLLRCRIRNAIKRQSKDTARPDRKAMPTMQLTGCTLAELRAHLESQFRDGMTWANLGKWHIDHAVPCSAFDLSKPDEQARCFHYTNLQPLWARENLAKHDSLPTPG